MLVVTVFKGRVGHWVSFEKLPAQLVEKGITVTHAL